MMHLLDALCCCCYLLVLLVCTASATWNTPKSERSSSRDKVIGCYKELEMNSDISHLLLDVTSTESFDQFCRRVSRLEKCVADNEGHLSNQENTKYYVRIQGLTNFYKNVCPPGSDITIKYKENAPCFKLIKNKILSCGSDLQDMSTYKMKQDLSSRCSALCRHQTCVSSAARDECGDEAGRLIGEMTRRYFRQHLDGCPNNVDLYPCLVINNAGRESEKDWSGSTLADEWKRHHKSKSHAESCSRPLSVVVTVVTSVVVVFVRFLLVK